MKQEDARKIPGIEFNWIVIVDFAEWHRGGQKYQWIQEGIK